MNGFAISRRRQRGLSLIELMVALVVTLLLGVAVGGVFVISQRGYRNADDFARIQDNARYSLRTLQQDLRLAGFWGDVTFGDIDFDNSGSLDSLTTDCTGKGAAYDSYASLFVTRVGSGVHTALGCITDAAPETDVLVVKHVAGFPLDVGDPLEAGKTYMISNKNTALLFDGDDTVPAVTDGRVWEYMAHIYYIREDPSDSSDLRLYRKTLRSTGGNKSMVSEEVAAGVENMRVLLGIDSDDDDEVDTYVDQSALTSDADWEDVMTAQVFLLVRGTEDPTYADERTYQLGDLAIAPGELPYNYHRSLVASTVILRNLSLKVKGKW